MPSIVLLYLENYCGSIFFLHYMKNRLSQLNHRLVKHGYFGLCALSYHSTVQLYSIFTLWIKRFTTNTSFFFVVFQWELHSSRNFNNFIWNVLQKDRLSMPYFHFQLIPMVSIHLYQSISVKQLLKRIFHSHHFSIQKILK